MKRMFFSVFLVILLIVAGCTSAPKQEEMNDTSSGSESVQEDTRSTESTVSGEETVTTVLAEETPTTRAKPEETIIDVESDLKAQLKDLFSNAAREYTVAYNTAVSGKGQENYRAQMVYYIKGVDKMRIDSLSDVSGSGETQLYILDERLIMCNKQSGEWNCLKMPSNAQSSQDPKKQSEDIQGGIDRSDITQLPGRVYAGVNAKCYKMVLSVSTQEAENSGMSSFDSTYCLSPEGVLLYSDTSAENMHMIQEATSYKTSVADSDFVPPAEPKDLSFSASGMPAGADMPGGQPEEMIDY